MRKRNFTSFEVLAEQVRKVELQIFANQDRAEVREQNFTYLAVKAERRAEAELHIFGGQYKTKVQTWNFRSLAVKAERKCGSGTSGLWQLSQSRRVEVEFQIFSRQDIAEVQSSTLAV